MYGLVSFIGALGVLGIVYATLINYLHQLLSFGGI
jgi:hypothetical protein